VKPHAIKDIRQNREIAASLVAFVVTGSNVAKSLVKKSIEAVGVWYRVEPYTNVGPDGRCEHSCGWGDIEDLCSSKPTCGY